MLGHKVRKKTRTVSQLQSPIAGSLQHISLRAAVQMRFLTSNQHKIGPETACSFACPCACGFFLGLRSKRFFLGDRVVDFIARFGQIVPARDPKQCGGSKRIMCYNAIDG